MNRSLILILLMFFIGLLPLTGQASESLRDAQNVECLAQLNQWQYAEAVAVE